MRGSSLQSSSRTVIMCWYINHDPVSTLFALLLVIKSEVGLCVVILIITDRTAVINAHLINKLMKTKEDKNPQKEPFQMRLVDPPDSLSFMFYLLVLVVQNVTQS